MFHNINDHVWVRLTEHGHAVLSAWYADLSRRVGHELPRPELRTVNGWTAFQTWCLMEKFGERSGMGTPLCFETTVWIGEEAPT